MSNPVDPELQAIKQITRALCKLSREARMRTLGFILSREGRSQADVDYILSWLPKRKDGLEEP